MLRAATEDQLAATEAEGYRRLAEHCIQNSDDVFTIEDGRTSVFRLSDLIDSDRISLIQRLIRQVVQSLDT